MGMTGSLISGTKKEILMSAHHIVQLDAVCEAQVLELIFGCEKQ